MSDTPEPNKGQGKTEETIFNSDIGDDWGEAFQAEDFMFSPDEEASSEFFLEDDSFDDETSVGHEETSSTAKDLKKEKVAPLSGLGKLFTLLDRLLALPLKFRIPALCLPIIIIIALLLRPQPSPELTDTDPQTTDPASTEEIKQDLPAADQQHGTDQAQTALNAPTENEKQIAAKEIPAEKVRKRWQLPSFLISSFNDELKSPALLAIDLTLVLLMAKEDVIPNDKELLVRETIFQFFNNRPYADLQKFTLSRGEMNRSLRAWINKQLPDIPLSSIVFERYQIL
nr:hypothetical protein [Desulfobulbaceae bacterium]